jgi:acetylglutamate kinase
MKQLIKKAKVLIEEALPYIQQFKGKVFVIKYGGKAMVSNHLKHSVMKDIAFLKSLGIKPVIVHGGGPEITQEMEKAKLKPKFVNGLRVTDEATIRIIDKVFKKINMEIRDMLKKFKEQGQTAANCLLAKQKDKKLGLVGEITKINKKAILSIINKGNIPIISPLAAGGNGKKYNINADTAATKVAIALKAEKLTILTDVDGVLERGKLVSHLSISDARCHIKKGIISAGMIPKVEACIEAIRSGCKKAHLINGTTPHALLFEIFTDKGIGTEVVKNGTSND